MKPPTDASWIVAVNGLLVDSWRAFSQVVEDIICPELRNHLAKRIKEGEHELMDELRIECFSAAMKRQICVQLENIPKDHQREPTETDKGFHNCDSQGYGQPLAI